MFFMHQPLHKLFISVTNQTFGSAELVLCSSAQMTELFSAEHRTFFFILHSMPMASFHIFILLDDPHGRGVIIDL